MAYILKRKWKNKTTYRVQVTRRGFKVLSKVLTVEQRQRSGAGLSKGNLIKVITLIIQRQID